MGHSFLGFLDSPIRQEALSPDAAVDLTQQRQPLVAERGLHLGKAEIVYDRTASAKTRVKLQHSLKSSLSTIRKICLSPSKRQMMFITVVS
ncbi:hypothetical protein RRG08_063581 [Elysia crispata]|uniref:Uncharacterized protein n=1 Tax=Elysia crispata TaxID=231223 RepID=A0AAE0YRS2_9GAST|nr:hypothetical protein RRG08_063581 [Elysia crispata]